MLVINIIRKGDAQKFSMESLILAQNERWRRA
jgi:hypothetical protein